MNKSKGTPEQLLNAVRQQISYLESFKDVTSAQDINSSDEFSGQPSELLDAVKTRIVNLEGNVESCDAIVSSEFPVSDVLEFLANKGYDVTDESVKQYAEGVADYMDISREAYEREDLEWPYDLDQWYADTQQNYPHDLEDLPKIESACNSANIMASDDFDEDRIWDIAELFSGRTTPITDSWDHDTLLEIGKIAEGLNCSLEQACDLMVNVLGFEREDVDIHKLADGESLEDLINKYSNLVPLDQLDSEHDIESADNVIDTYDVVEADADVEDVQLIEDDVEPVMGDDADKLDSEFDAYITELSDDVTNTIIQDSEVADLDWHNDDENMYVTAVINDRIIDFTIPYSDLSQDLSKDTEYIVTYILDELSV